MEAVHSPGDGKDLETGPHFTEETAPGELRGWEEIDAGRFMPRRIRGSYRGRALG
jgi:hypothetical protein